MLQAHAAVAYAFHPPDRPPGGGSTFSIPNPVDFYAYRIGGAGLVIECKAVKTKSLPFKRFNSTKENKDGIEYGRQWRALKRCHDGGVDTFALVNFYGWSGRDGLRGRAFAVPFGPLEQWRESFKHKRKSWPVSVIEALSFELVKVGGSRQRPATWEWLTLEP